MRAAWFSLVVLASSPALAEPLTSDTPSTGDDHAVALAVELGAVGGGGATPGGMRVGGRYLYRMAERDWFDGAVAFTFGRPGAGCGRVPPDGMACDHGVADGFAGDLSLGVRRELGRDPAFVPFVRAAVFARILRFSADDVTGAAAGGELGAGLRARVSPDLSLIGGATAFAGRARLGNDIGGAGQLGLVITGGAELRMR